MPTGEKERRKKTYTSLFPNIQKKICQLVAETIQCIYTHTKPVDFIFKRTTIFWTSQKNCFDALCLRCGGYMSNDISFWIKQLIHILLRNKFNTFFGNCI